MKRHDAQYINKRYRSVDERVFYFMKDFSWWTFWDLQQRIKDDFGVFYGEPTISAAIRELRKSHSRAKFDFPKEGEVVERERIPNGKGYRYRLAHQIMKSWKEI